MAKKYNYNYNPNSSSGKQQIKLNPWAVLILFIVLLVINIGFTIAMGVTAFALLAIVACFIGIAMAVNNIMKKKGKKL